MKEVLYIGPYHQNDEWGSISKGIVRSLIDQDIKLSIRPVWFNQDKRSQNIQFLEKYEANKVEAKDILIQHGLPTFLNPDHDFKTNIAVTSIDCNIEDTMWPYHLNMFDLVVVFSQFEADLLRASGVSPEKTVAFPAPPLFMTPQNPSFDINFSEFKFYTDCQFGEGGGLKDIIVSYLSEFSILDDVVLVVSSMDTEKSKREIETIKDGLGIYKDNKKYAHIAIISAPIGHSIDVMHRKCDSFICTNYNARISQNLLKSLVYNKIPIVLDTVKDSFQKWPCIVSSYEDVCLYKSRPLPELYSGKTMWRKPLKGSLKYNMRYVYNKYKNKDLSELQEKIFVVKNRLMSIDWKVLCQ